MLLSKEVQMNLSQYFKDLTNLSEEETVKLIAAFKMDSLPKGHLLFQQGEICKRVFFIQKGIARIYYRSVRGKDITAWFCDEGTYLAAIDGFFQNKPTRENCELLEDSIVFSLEYETLVALLNNSDIAKIAFHVACELLNRITEFLSGIRFQSSKERFENLMKERPSIFLRAPLGHIASYLGMTQETLSRMRSKKQERL